MESRFEFLPIAVVLILALAIPVHATVLTFQPATNFGPIDQAYGDHVASTSQNGFLYEPDGGFTPNLTVDYGPLPQAAPTLYGTGFGNLLNVLYEDADGFGILEITIEGDDQWLVKLAGFDLGSYGVSNTIRRVSVHDNYGNVLFSQYDVEVEAIAHTSFDFDPPLAGDQLVIRIDTSNLGYSSDNVAIDNVQFSQAPKTTPVDADTWASLKAQFR